MKSFTNSFSRSYPNALFCNSFLLEADGEAPSKMNWGGEARNPGFDMLLRQAHVSRCSFVLQLFTAKLPLSYLFPWAPSAKPRRLCSSPCFSSQNKQRLEMNPLRCPRAERPVRLGKPADPSWASSTWGLGAAEVLGPDLAIQRVDCSIGSSIDGGREPEK